MHFKQQALEQAVAAAQTATYEPALRSHLLACMDLTSLNDSDTPQVIAALCTKAAAVQPLAAVCVYPAFVKTVAQFFSHSPIQVASVVNFPKGQGSLASVQKEIASCLADGADEIDVVFPLQTYLGGQRAEALRFIQSCKESCGEHLLKVILEVGLIADLSLISELTAQVASSGADFIKTSTGKVASGASLEAAAAILLTIREVAPQLGRPLGFKVAGGVREPQQAAQYWQLTKGLMGPAWLTPAHFRIGASTLLDKLS